MSPEQIRGRQADVRSDIYSLGIVLYTLLAGRAPFDGQNDFELMKSQLEQAPPPLRALVGNLPPKVEAAVMRALEKDPSARFQTVAAFSRELDACLAELATASPWTADALDMPTMSCTVVNAEPLDVHRSPRRDAGRAAPSPSPGTLRQMPARESSAADRGRPTTASWMRPTTRNRLAGALGVAAVLVASVLGVPHLVAMFEAPAAASPGHTLAAAARPQAIAPVEHAAAIQIAAVPAQETTTAAVAQPLKPPLVGDAVTPPTLAIVHLPSGDRAEAAVRTVGNAAPTASGAVHRFKPGERIRLLITPSRDAHVYCYLQDERRRIVRFYPNRFSASTLVKTAAPLEIPGPMRFELVANHRNVTETVACFASERDVMGELPAAVVGTDFKALPVASLDQVTRAFTRIAADTLAQASFRVQF